MLKWLWKALAYGLGGMTAGYVQTINPEPTWWMASMSAAVGAAVGESAIPVIDVVAGQSGWVQRSLWVTVPDPHPNANAMTAFTTGMVPRLLPQSFPPENR